VSTRLSKVIKLVGGWAAWEAAWWAHSRWERGVRWKEARALADASGKELLVVGAPMGMYPCGDTTVDIKDPSAFCPIGGVEASVEDLPFRDKQFGAVYVSHVLEHCCHPDVALEELHRVADHVVVSYPRWWRGVTWFSPGHTWLMWPDQDEWRFLRIRSNCNRSGFLGLG
jgi:SAM-dependent methyltransferase